MPSQLSVTCDAASPDRLARFWAGLLGREIIREGEALLVPGDDTQPDLRFVPSLSEKTGPNLIHFHLTTSSLAGQLHTVEAALGLGAHHLDVGQRPEEGHIVLGDPEGNELCVIEPGNSFLDGCGFLGELACDGSRDVGLFWSAATGWPLVWDQDEETAIQSPRGGTKVAWGGPPLTPRTGRSRQRLRLTAAGGDLGAEADRLVALGATRLADSEGGIALADPDGNEFFVTGG